MVGVETVNVVAHKGTNTSADSDFEFLANSANSLKAVNISGSADGDLNIVATSFFEKYLNKLRQVACRRYSLAQN